MRYPRFLIALLVALCLPAMAAAQTPDSFTERFTLDVQLGQFMDRLYEVLTREQWLGQYPEVRTAAEAMRHMGVFNYQSVNVQKTVENGKVHFHCSEQFADLPADSYLGKVYALPNRPLASANYLNPEGFVMYAGMNNVPQQALLALDEFSAMSQPGGPLAELMGGHDMDMAEVMGMLEAFQIEEQVNEILTGEVALTLFKSPELGKLMGDFQPGDLDAAVFVGVKDAARLQQLSAMFAGQAGLTPMGGDMAGWTGYYIPDMPQGGIMWNSELLIASPNIFNALSHLDFNKGGLTTPACQCYFDLNLTALHDQLVAPGMAFLEGQAPVNLASTKEAAAYLFALPASSQLGHVRAHTAYANGYSFDMTMSTALANYAFYYLGVGISGVAQAELGDGAGGMEDSGMAEGTDE
jgi:hypothetical protein